MQTQLQLPLMPKAKRWDEAQSRQQNDSVSVQAQAEVSADLVFGLQLSQQPVFPNYQHNVGFDGSDTVQE